MIKNLKKKLLDNKYYLAVSLFLTATCLHMLHSVIIKSIGLKGVYSTYEVIFIRSIVVAIVLTSLFITKKVKFVERKNLKTNLLFACFSIIGSYCWHYGLHMVPVNNAIIINYMIPMVIPMLAVIILKEKLSKTLIASIIICFTSILIVNKPKEILKLGYLLILLDVLLLFNVNCNFKKIDDKKAISYCCVLFQSFSCNNNFRTHDTKFIC